MRFETEAIVCALRTHAEHGAVVRMLTPEHGLVAAYVRGARGRRVRPVLIAGNVVMARVAARTEDQLPHADLELIHSRAPLMREPLAASAIEWATALTATVLPERHPYPHIHEALDAVLAAIEAAPSAVGWGPVLVRFELLLLAELGFGLDLDRCAVTESNDRLVAVSPKSGRAVSASAAEPYADRLLPLPAFLRDGGPAAWSDIADGLELTGHFLLRDLLGPRAVALADARSRLVERLRRAGGLA